MILTRTYARKRIHEEWESVYHRSPIQDKFNDAILKRIVGYLDSRPDALFLDAGCGVGYHSARIAQRGYRCIGVDISERILGEAKENSTIVGVQSRVSFVCQELERLSFKDQAFDYIYCRGVLMHIPDWTRALSHLCRVLKPGGKIVIMEANQSSLEASLVLLIRRIKARKSKLVKTAAGLEFWSDVDGNPFVARVANMKYLINELKKYRVDTIVKMASEFWDINRFPAGIVREAIIRYNQLWFSLRLPAFLSVGNILIGEKR